MTLPFDPPLPEPLATNWLLDEAWEAGLRCRSAESERTPGHLKLAAAIKVLEAHGFKLVAPEPTEHMRRVVAHNWGSRTWREFADVLAAAPSIDERLAQ